MIVKILKWIGIAACILLIISSFLPWTYHADLNETFTGFFSEKNIYGKPGKFFVSFGIISIVLILLPKVWAKRFHLFLSALFTGYAIKTYILFTSCYNTYCPDKKPGIYLMIGCCIVILVVSIFPDLKLKEKLDTNYTD